jgi:DNA-binding MarR family transcriptional regulator
MDLLFLLNQASFALGNDLAARLSTVGITTRHFCVLNNAASEELTQIRLAERSMLDKTTMVATLDELEKAGLAERRPSPTDRRVRIVSVTEKGEAAIAAAQGVVDEMQDELLAKLPEEQRDAFVDALTSLVDGPLATPSHVERTLRRPRERTLVPN